ncbi:uncharacterized protein LOC116052086 isoform X13 [Sander lucioperca]|uniref:uncharacterized protein LOC116052086 isoform X13 n=1 Tax=Sander lucioperca TaxID=283035 RepID=UPI00125D1B15|nr:uncharacterized protein LOC116052086 isoform X13 [Sander lucioperca]
MTDTVQQNFRMLHQMAGLSLQSPPRTISVLAVLLLAHSCRGQSQLIGAPKPIVAAAGDDVILPCHLQPTEDVAAKTLEWTRPNLNPRFVFVWRAGQDLENVKNPSYKGRTLLFPDELKQGNMSLKLSKVKPSDAGRYKCYIPDMNIDSFIELVVGAVSLPFISLAGTDRDKGGVVLQCESKGWYPEPEVLWLDGEGNLLSAGPSETVRGPDDLYTVSSRVTVEKRPSNSFTCRVQQKNTNQTRETEIHVTDDFFEVQSSSSVPIITGLAVSLSVCIILFILLLLFSVWKWRQNKINMKISHGDETDKERNRTKDPSVTAEETKALTGEKVKKIKLEQQRREEAEREVQTLKEELETKKEEFESKLAEVQQQLKDEKQKHEDEQKALQKMKDDMQAKIKELEGKAGLSLYELKIFNKKTLEEEQQKREDAEKQVQILTQKLDEEEKQRSENEHLQKELEDKIKKFESKLAEVQQQLKDEKQKHEDAQQAHQKMKDDMQVKNKEFESKLAEVQQQLKDEKQKHEDAQQAHQKMKDDMQVKNKELEDKAGLSLEEQQKREEAEKPVQILTQKLDEKNNKSKEKVARSKSLRNWNIRSKSTREKEQQKKEEAEKEDLTQKLDDKNNEQVKDCESALSKSQDHTLTSPSFQDSATEHIIVDEVDLEGKYVRLSNKSNKDIPLGGWELHLHVDNRKPIKYQFVQTFELKAGEAVTIWVSGCDVWRDTSTELVWFSQTSWGTGEQLLVCLYSNTGELGARKFSEGRIIVNEVDPEGKYVRLTNKSNKDKPLEGWELHLQINNRKPSMYKSFYSFILKAGGTVTIWASGCGVDDNPSTDLVWRNQNPWDTGEQLLVSLYSSNGELEARKFSEGRIIVNEVDPEGEYVRLTNKSNKDKPLEGWELHLQINNRKPSMYTSFFSFILKTGGTVTIWASGCGVNDNPSTDLVWRNQNPWGTGEQLLVSIYSSNGELEASRMLKPEKSQGQISHQTSQDSDKGRFTLDEVDPEGKFVCLCNASNEDQELQGWELHIRVNNRKPIMRTFNYGDVLKAGMTFKVNMKKSWSDGDQLLIFLYSITGEEMAMKKVGF